MRVCIYSRLSCWWSNCSESDHSCIFFGWLFTVRVEWAFYSNMVSMEVSSLWMKSRYCKSGTSSLATWRIFGIPLILIFSQPDNAECTRMVLYYWCQLFGFTKRACDLCIIYPMGIGAKPLASLLLAFAQPPVEFAVTSSNENLVVGFKPVILPWL